AHFVLFHFRWERDTSPISSSGSSPTTFGSSSKRSLKRAQCLGVSDSETRSEPRAAPLVTTPRKDSVAMATGSFPGSCQSRSLHWTRQKASCSGASEKQYFTEDQLTAGRRQVIRTRKALLRLKRYLD